MMILIIRYDNFIKRKTIIDNKSQQMGLGQYTPQTTKSENLLFCVCVIIHTNDSKSSLNQYIYIFNYRLIQEKDYYLGKKIIRFYYFVAS